MSSVRTATAGTQFQGFTPLDANYLYCPNQFLDLCLPHASRGAVRLVAYLLDQTLGWLDSDGQPITQEVSVTYNELINAAGISRGAIRQVIDEAIRARFIQRIREGRSAANQQPAQQAAYALRWDTGDAYQDNPESFQGFYAGDGYRTPIPNAFFREVIPQEPLSVTKVVGSVLRHTVGYQNQFGGRRSQAVLSYQFIQKYTNMPDPKTLSQALSSAIASRYIIRVEQGRFHTDPAQRTAATYSVKWLQQQRSSRSGSKNPAGKLIQNGDERAVQKNQRDRFNNPSRSGSENPAAKRFKKTSTEKTAKKDIQKQQPAAAKCLDGFRLLSEAGFDHETAVRLAKNVSSEQVSRQIDWLSRRNIQHSRLGMLRKAIEENWPEPDQPPDIKAVLSERRERDRQHDLEQHRREQAVNAEKARRRQRKAELKKMWDTLPETERRRIEAVAWERQPSESLKRLFRKSESHRRRESLRQLDCEQP